MALDRTFCNLVKAQSKSFIEASWQNAVFLEENRAKYLICPSPVIINHNPANTRAGTQITSIDLQEKYRNLRSLWGMQWNCNGCIEKSWPPSAPAESLRTLQFGTNWLSRFTTNLPWNQRKFSCEWISCYSWEYHAKL